MRGYWHLPSQTSEVLSEDGWLSTGDMVTREPGGHVVLRGRKKELFIQGGYNVYPVEVENVLASHPAVSVVAGTGLHDALPGEVGLYCVQLRPGAQVTEQELRDFCAQRLADYKVPRHFAWPDSLPLTPAGKVSKSERKRRYG